MRSPRCGEEAITAPPWDGPPMWVHATSGMEGSSGSANRCLDSHRPST
jgi:hypothetical protein